MAPSTQWAIFQTQAAAQAACAAIDAALPAYPQGSVANTWAVPILLADGTYTIPVPPTPAAPSTLGIAVPGNAQTPIQGTLPISAKATQSASSAASIVAALTKVAGIGSPVPLAQVPFVTAPVVANQPVIANPVNPANPVVANQGLKS